VTHAYDVYEAGDWFVTSLIKSISELNDGYIIETLNSHYLVDTPKVIDIPEEAIGNIRAGTGPQVAVEIYKGTSLKTD